MIRQAKEDDLQQIAKIHKTCFANHFASHISGDKECYLLQRFYLEFINTSPELFLVEECDGEVVGFCMGYKMEQGDFMLSFFKHNIVKTLWRFFVLLISFDKVAWEKLNTLVNRKSRPKFEVINHSFDYIKQKEIADLLSICVLPDFRGKGFAQKLILSYLQRVKELNRKLCLLSVEVTNVAAIHLYEKSGFIPYRKMGETGMTYLNYLE